MLTNIFANNRKWYKFATTNSNFEKKSITLDTCQSITSMYTNFQQSRVSIDQSKPCTQSNLQKIVSCINMQLTIRISKPNFFRTCISLYNVHDYQFSARSG